MRDRNVFNKSRALPRMSWSPHNLYNLWQRTLGPLTSESNFTRSHASLFQQRWRSKRLVRGYHGDFIGEDKFKRWYLPATLPDVRPRRRAANENQGSEDLSKWVMRNKDVSKESTRRQKEEEEGTAPVGSLFLSEVERRLDVTIFRACFAPSVYHARHMVTRGRVKLNGRKYINPNTRLEPGDLISVDPTAIPFLRKDALKDKFTYGKTVQPSRAQRTEIASKAWQDAEDSEQASGKAEGNEEVKAAHDGNERVEAEDNEDAKEEPDKDQSADSSPPRASSMTATTRVETTTSSTIASNGTVFHLPPYASPFLFIPAYLEVSFPVCSAVYIRHPTARPGYSEIPTPYDADGEVMRLAWEWYSNVRPRMRRKRDLWMSPDRTFGRWRML